MDTEVFERSGSDASRSPDPTTGTEVLPPAVESTIDEVDHLLDEVEAALGRLDEGTYGACGVCGGTIDDASLSVEPTVRNCAQCELAGPDPSRADEVVADAADGVDDDGDERGPERFNADRAPWAGRVPRTDPQ